MKRKAPSKWFEPELPAHLRDDFTVLAAQHLRGQSRLLFIGFILSLPMTIAAQPEASPIWVGWGLPLLVLLASALGIWFVRAQPTESEAASRLLKRAWMACFFVAATGSLWGVMCWLYAAPEVRVYYTAILSIGGLTMGYTLTATRLIAASAIIVALLPICIAMLTTGRLLDAALATGLLIALSFQILILGRQRRLMLELVNERNSSHRLARLDPLTGLDNRRALLENAENLGADGTPLRLILIDLDRFKLVNDRYGHDTGDEVLMIIATIVARRAKGDVRAARLGGEEFALMGPAGDLGVGEAQGILHEIRTAEMPHGEILTASAGIAMGRVMQVGDWSDIYANADRALYTAKNGGRDRVEEYLAEVEQPLRIRTA